MQGRLSISEVLGLVYGDRVRELDRSLRLLDAHLLRVLARQVLRVPLSVLEGLRLLVRNDRHRLLQELALLGVGLLCRER